jgi:hypothetical protein
MTLLLDALALAAVVGAVVYLWRARRPSCADCPPRRRTGETRIALNQLRAAARRAGDRR